MYRSEEHLRERIGRLKVERQRDAWRSVAINILWPVRLRSGYEGQCIAVDRVGKRVIIETGASKVDASWDDVNWDIQPAIGKVARLSILIAHDQERGHDVKPYRFDELEDAKAELRAVLGIR